MTSILYQMKSSFVGGLHFIDGKPPIFEILPWCISRHMDPSLMPKSKVYTEISSVILNDELKIFM